MSNSIGVLAKGSTPILGLWLMKSLRTINIAFGLLMRAQSLWNDKLQACVVIVLNTYGSYDFEQAKLMFNVGKC